MFSPRSSFAIIIKANDDPLPPVKEDAEHSGELKNKTSGFPEIFDTSFTNFSGPGIVQNC